MPWQVCPGGEPAHLPEGGDTLAVAEVKLLEKQTEPAGLPDRASSSPSWRSISVGPARGPTPPRSLLWPPAWQGSWGPWLRGLHLPDLALGLEMCPWHYLHLQG